MINRRLLISASLFGAVGLASASSACPSRAVSNYPTMIAELRRFIDMLLNEGVASDADLRRYANVNLQNSWGNMGSVGRYFRRWGSKFPKDFKKTSMLEIKNIGKSANEYYFLARCKVIDEFDSCGDAVQSTILITMESDLIKSVQMARELGYIDDLFVSSDVKFAVS